jgi:hypothetical protein
MNLKFHFNEMNWKRTNLKFFKIFVYLWNVVTYSKNNYNFVMNLAKFFLTYESFLNDHNPEI